MGFWTRLTSRAHLVASALTTGLTVGLVVSLFVGLVFQSKAASLATAGAVLAWTSWMAYRALFPVQRSEAQRQELLAKHARRAARLGGVKASPRSAQNSWASPDTPAFNINGAPMVGGFDIYGNTFGVTGLGPSTDMSSNLSMEPSMNVNGLPMCGSFDTNGNTYGSTLND